MLFTRCDSEVRITSEDRPLPEKAATRKQPTNLARTQQPDEDEFQDLDSSFDSLGSIRELRDTIHPIISGMSLKGATGPLFAPQQTPGEGPAKFCSVRQSSQASDSGNIPTLASVKVNDIPVIYHDLYADLNDSVLSKKSDELSATVQSSSPLSSTAELEGEKRLLGAMES